MFISSTIGFLEDLAIQFTQLKMSEIILTDRKPQMERKKKIIKCEKRSTEELFMVFLEYFFCLAEVFFSCCAC